MIVEVYGMGVGRVVSYAAHYITVEFTIDGHVHLVEVEHGDYQQLPSVGYEVI